MSKLAEARAFVCEVEKRVTADDFEGLCVFAAAGEMEFDDRDPQAWKNRCTGGL